MAVSCAEPPDPERTALSCEPERSVESSAVGRGYPPTMSLEQVEAAHIRSVLEHTAGRMGEAAEILGVHRNTITAKVREYGIDVGSRSGAR